MNQLLRHTAAAGVAVAGMTLGGAAFAQQQNDGGRIYIYPDSSTETTQDLRESPIEELSEGRPVEMDLDVEDLRQAQRQRQALRRQARPIQVVPRTRTVQPYGDRTYGQPIIIGGFDQAGRPADLVPQFDEDFDDLTQADLERIEQARLRRQQQRQVDPRDLTGFRRGDLAGGVAAPTGGTLGPAAGASAPFAPGFDRRTPLTAPDAGLPDEGFDRDQDLLEGARRVQELFPAAPGVTEATERVRGQLQDARQTAAEFRENIVQPSDVRSGLGNLDDLNVDDFTTLDDFDARGAEGVPDLRD